MTVRQQRGLARICGLVTAVVIILLPFHAFFTTWLGSNFGHLDAWRIWKEVLLVGLIPPTLVLLWSRPRLVKQLFANWLIRCIVAYIMLYLLLGLLALSNGNVNANALIYSWLSNLRFLGFFIVVLVIANFVPRLRTYWQQLVLLPGAIVVAFGLLQRLVLPYDFLKHFGYGDKTIPAYQTVDQKLAYRRVQSTLRGANPLGAYLVLVFGALLPGKPQLKKYLALFATAMVLFYTYSRSAWIGVVLTLACYGYLSITNTKLRRRLAVLAVVGVVVVGLGVIDQRHNKIVENTFFHTDTTSQSGQSSNTSRAAALEDGVHDIILEPFGRGPGTAGPASTRNNHPARIAEDYYLQVGQEAGMLGLILFLAINWQVSMLLYKGRQDEFNRILLATLIGISFINLLSHAWADDTLGLLWWGLAGLALSPVILSPDKHKHHERQTTKKATA